MSLSKGDAPAFTQPASFGRVVSLDAVRVKRAVDACRG